MRITVCLKEVVDTSLDMAFSQISRQLWQKGLVAKINPADASALSLALKLKETITDADISLITIGSPQVECSLKKGMEWGAARAIRIWDQDMENLSAYRKARILAKAITINGADLVLTGTKSLDNGSGQVSAFLAAWLDKPCITGVTSFEMKPGQREVIVTRNIRHGLRERIAVALPTVLAVEVLNTILPFSSLEKLLASQEAPISLLSLSDLGFSPLEFKNDPTETGRLSFPRPRVKAVPTPDSALPSFYRILALLEGGIKKRHNEVFQGENSAMVERLYNLMLKEGILKSAIPDSTAKPR